ncbi:UDP-glucose:glycoprotein glucosyltransferase 1 [Aphelenchoides besseyi]|nr:UDP-glucose:glycoprotein glucosyltransferase 1 [Aphelenchoides besseyi]
MKWPLLSLFLIVNVFLVNGKKSVSTTLQSRWNHTSFLAETSEFIATEDIALFWQLLDKIADQVDTKAWSQRTHEFEYESALKIGSEVLGETRTDLLKLSLSLRLFSPRVQVHQQIGDEYQTECDAFVDVAGEIVCDAKQIKKLAEQKKDDSTKAWIYSSDKTHPKSNTKAPLTILYAELGTDGFASFHKVLKPLAESGAVQYVMRNYVSPKTRKENVAVGLSGYGVELAIKNTEYKAVDDSHVHEVDEKDEDDLHGLDFAVLKSKHPESTEALKQLKTHLSEMEELTPLKQWEVSDLSYQAAQKIMDATPEDALAQLTDLSQNFPIRSRILVRTRVSEAFKKEVQENQAYLNENYNINEGENALFVNGISVDTDALDVFQLYETVRAESRLAATFYDMGFRREYLALLYSQNFGAEKASYSLDYRSANPEYLNNLDKDKQYQNWGNSVKALLQPTYMGMLRPIARNFFTLIFIVDPAAAESKSLMSVGHSLYIHKVPIRIGFVFVVNQDKSANGMNDVGVALLNLYNFAKGDRNSAAKALDLMVKTLDYAEGNLTPDRIHQFFKKKFPDVSISDVFDKNSDYDTGRIAGGSFLKKSGIGKAPKVLLNGIMLEDSAVTTDRIEEAILMQIMRQTAPLQRAVMSGKLKDKDNVQNWILNQPDVLPRLNSRLIAEPTKVLSMSNVYPCSANNLRALESKNEAQKVQCIVENAKYLTLKDDARTRWLTLWLAVDLDQQKGRKLVFNALEFLRKSEDARIYLLHTGAANSKVAKFVRFIVSAVNAEHAQGILKKATADGQWLQKVQLDLSKLQDLNLKNLNVEELKKSFEKFTDKQAEFENHFVRSVLDLNEGQQAVIVNGYVYGPLDADEEIEFDDFALIQQLAIQKGTKTIGEHVEEWQVEVKDGKSSDVVMRSSATLGKHAIRKERQYLSVPGDSESVLHLLASDQKRPVVDLVAVVDPLSKAAQKLSSVIGILTRVVNCDLKIIMNPKEKLSELPLKRFYRFAFNDEPLFDTTGSSTPPAVTFTDLPNKQLLTLSVISPDSWMTQAVSADYDLDNLKMQHVDGDVIAKYELVHLLLEGHCFDDVTGSPPRGLQFILGTSRQPAMFDSLVMANLGYLQLKATPGAWILQLREGKSKDIYEIHNHTNTESDQESQEVRVLVDSFLGRTIRVRVGKKPGKEDQNLLTEAGQDDTATMFGLNDEEEEGGSLWSSISSTLGGGDKHEKINIFSLASGHLYERFLRIMMLSVIKNTKHPVKFWLLNNYLSPQFRDSLPRLAAHYKFEFELVEYKWPRWLHQQSEKQRIMWGYKILFLDVLFPLNVRKIIFVDADQVVRTDMMELMNFDLGGAPYGYTPFCDSRTTMEGFRFWKQGYWASHLAGRRYHISALYVVDLAKFRQIAAGDRLRGQYQGLSSDPNSLSNLDQDLPNNMIHQVRIKSLPQEWLWCETWCSDDSKAKAKTIDLCNNPQTKEPKLDSAVRIIPEWKSYDEEIKNVLQGSSTIPPTEETDDHDHNEL